MPCPPTKQIKRLKEIVIMLFTTATPTDPKNTVETSPGESIAPPTPSPDPHHHFRTIESTI